MPSTLSGRIVKSRKCKTGTLHQKNHRWESFTTKISKLHSLDPLRKVRRHDLEAEDLDSTTSYFKNGLEKWADLDISKGFTSFRREVMPLCDSLPQILHFESRIMDLLEKYLAARERESLESLLDLLTAFAHDLGTRFEKYFPRALQLIIDVASSRQDADATEWTFAALAFLFKYLSRLLVPDLRPTYDTIASLLGKARNPPHIARFAAEAMSFLIKKAAAPSHRDKALPLIIEHARSDLQSTRGDRQYGLYYHGLMTMFAEAIKGQGRGVHTTGPSILKALVASVPDADCYTEESDTWVDVVCGVLVSVIHHTDAEGFTPIAEAIYEQNANDESCVSCPLRSILYLRLLGTMTGVRKGTRISNWATLLNCLRLSLDHLCKEPQTLSVLDESAIWRYILVNVAIIWYQAPMDSAISHIADLMKVLTREPLMKWFVPFCAYLSELDASQFRSLFLKHFQKFVVQHWSEDSNEDMLCVFIPKMIEAGALPSTRDAESFSLPQSWQDQIVIKFERLEISPFPEENAAKACDKDPKTWRDRCLPKYSSLLHLLECTTVRPSTTGPISEILLRKLKFALKPSMSMATDEARFIVSQGFSAYLRMSKAAGSIDRSLGPLLRAAAPRYSHLTGFLEAMALYENLMAQSKDSTAGKGNDGSVETEVNPLLRSLINNLSSSSADLRLASLNLLSRLDAASDQLDILATMLQIQQTPLELQNIRAISLHIRKLAATYPQLTEGSWFYSAVPAFLFGLMTVRLTPIWEPTVEALKEIGQTKFGEGEICDRAFRWLDVPSVRWNGPGSQGHASSNPGLTDFECINLGQLLDKARGTEHVIDKAADIILQTFEDSQQWAPESPKNARSQALKVLSATPNLAEKRSRKVVPMFLSWSLENDEQPDGSYEEAESAGGMSWSLADRKALLGVFAQFSNPKVLFQSQRVYDALLRQLANGDIDVQKVALKAILAWKQEGVRPYQENLEYLLDEARFKNELTVLFQGDNQIQSEHRSEVVPILLRLLYGRAISKKGVASGRGGLQANRLAILRQLSVEDMGSFLNIALGDLHGVEVVKSGIVCEDAFEREIMTTRKQAGFLNMMSSMINELGTSVEAYANTILNAVLYCLVMASRKLEHGGEAGEEGEKDEEEASSQTSLLRTVRTMSLKCVISLMRNAPFFNWPPFRDLLIKEIVSPRLEKLAIENTQGISGLLQLLSAFSSLPNTALFLAVDDRIIPKLMDCASTEKAKAEVRVFALGIIRNLVRLSQAPATESEFNELIQEELIDPHLDLILSTISGVLESQGELERDLLAACVDTVVELSPIVQQSSTTTKLLDISVYLLNQPSRRVNPKVKGRLLTILERFLQLERLASDSDLRAKIYTTVSTLFSFFKDRSNRQALSRVLAVFAGDDATLLEIASLCAQLNSYVDGRIDEPDYEKRLAAFNAVSRPRDVAFKAQQWEPLLQNMLFYIKHDEEYGVLSSNAADGICRFVDVAASSTDEEKDAYFSMLSETVLSAVYAGAREPSETVRREIVRVLGHMVSRLPSWPPVSDLTGLDPPPDENDSDPSFFSHILSPATTRQMRALQLLSKVNYHAELYSRNLAHFFVPLLEHLIFGREDGSDDHGVGAQATTAIAEVSISLEWPQFRAVLRRYIGYIESRPEAQKQLVRLLDKLTDTLARAVSEIRDDTTDVDYESEKRPLQKHRLASTMPATEKFTEDLVSSMLPPLLEYIHEKDDATVSSRVPVGIIIVKLLKLMPPKVLEQQLPGVLSDICHILRSKAWEAREMARDTLAKVTSILGSSYFGFVLDELRGALTKGYQLHVLSYTMHTLLINGNAKFKPGDLDYCLERIVEVIMDDIFGATGLEKDAEEYVSKMKEVKSSKSQDSMELIARTTSISSLAELVRPLQSLLLEKLDLRMTRKIDELLTRIANGLLSNAAADSRDTLVFCYEVIQKVYESEKPEAEPQIPPKLRRYLVQKGAKKSGERGTNSKCTYKLVRFAFDVLRSVLRKHDSLRNAANIAGFIPILGDAVVGGEEEVKIAAFKLLTVLVKVPFKTDEFSKLYKVAAKEATKSIGMSTSTNTDLAQTALKLISVILRDRRDVVVKDAAIDMLLGKLKDDLTEPLYRHVTFNFLRSVLERKVETATVYDILDHVGTIMITNDDQDTRDLARGAFFQFLRDYPQKKSRWAKQLSFVVANLKYEREGGRLSVMEVIHLLLMKSADDFVQEVATTCFIPLIFVLANDDSEACRLASSELIKEIFRKSDKERTTKFLTLLRNWLDQDDNQSVLRLAIQAFALYFDAREPTPRDQKDLDLVIEKMTTALEEYTGSEEDWELIHVILQSVPTLRAKHESTILAHKGLWDAIGRPLTSSNVAVKLSAVKLLNIYLEDFFQNGKESAEGDGTTGSHGLHLDQDAVEALVLLAVSILNPGAVARWRKHASKRGDSATADSDSSSQDSTTYLDENLAYEVGRTLAMLAKFLDTESLDDESTLADDETEAEEGEEAEDEWNGVKETPSTASAPKVTLRALFVMLSDILIAETPTRSQALIPKVKAMELLTLYSSTFPVTTLASSLNIILTPLHHITDPSIPIPVSVDDNFKTVHEKLRNDAETLMDALQRKMGSEVYTRELLKINEEVKRRRQSRARKRKIEAVSQPEKYGRWKKGRLEKKVRRRKERAGENRERRRGARNF